MPPNGPQVGIAVAKVPRSSSLKRIDSRGIHAAILAATVVENNWTTGNREIRSNFARTIWSRNSDSPTNGYRQCQTNVRRSWRRWLRLYNPVPIPHQIPFTSTFYGRHAVTGRKGSGTNRTGRPRQFVEQETNVISRGIARCHLFAVPDGPIRIHIGRGHRSHRWIPWWGYRVARDFPPVRTRANIGYSHLGNRPCRGSRWRSTDRHAANCRDPVR